MMTEASGIGMTSARTRERLVARLRAKGIESVSVLNAIRETPRHLFVDEALASRAYEDTALPIGHGQTISQPFVVARMTEALLAAGMPDKVLEVGSGSGYQTAVLAKLAPAVYTVERIQPLVERGRRLLRELGVRNVRFKHSDGSWGWPEQGPFDGILVTAAPEEVPAALLEQLAPGGRMVIPVGGRGFQELLRITRKDDHYEQELLDKVSFVPLLGGTQ
ncbi:MAG TPA: protein-L-isoaspartate(D-aspartate) O-methyltransferase [Gammaproteobacteria bacterium]|nr:protein-L-isoaspartate(D-aspartate) O-methyltransferase [Gammaproteobacteria bacterium]